MSALREQARKFMPIPGFPGYSATADGTIYSHWSKTTFGHAGWKSSINYDIRIPLRPERDRCGYWRVKLKKPGLAKRVWVRVNRAVLLAFRGPAPCPEMDFCAHKDDDSNNNAITNLRWSTRKRNTEDKLRNRARKGLPWQTFIKSEEQSEILTMAAEDISLSIIASLFPHLSKSCISDLIAGRTYKKFRKE